MNEMLEARVNELAQAYEKFNRDCEETGAMESKSGKGLAIRWAMGGGSMTRRDWVCEEFRRQVEALLQDLPEQLQEAETEDAHACADAIGELMLCPRNAASNDSADLMCRALVSLYQPLVGFLTAQQAEKYLLQLESAYPKRTRLPVEQALGKALKKRGKV